MQDNNDWYKCVWLSSKFGLRVGFFSRRHLETILCSQHWSVIR